MIRARTTLALAAATICAAPASAQAVAVTVTGDDGNPIPFNGDLVIRTMDAKVAVTPSGGEKVNLAATYVGPDGANAATPMSCSSSGSTRSMEYRGNGTYTIQVTTYGEKDFSCKTPLGPPSTYRYSVNAGVALAALPFRPLIRQPNGFVTQNVTLPISLNPGAIGYEVRYAPGGVIGPDGAISGPSAEGFVDRATGTVSLRMATPGRYAVVARARSGQFNTPWSAPVFVDAIAPFDLQTSRTPDARGPSYRIAITVRELSAAGSRVRLAYARGRKGGRYRSLGTARINAKGVFTKRFTLRRSGVYRMRFTFAGSPTVAPGVVVQQFRVSRRIALG
jgi:hypothetical protein